MLVGTVWFLFALIVILQGQGLTTNHLSKTDEKHLIGRSARG
jgi:hypothetical protein